jgi:hypothetical protein
MAAAAHDSAAADASAPVDRQFRLDGAFFSVALSLDGIIIGTEQGPEVPGGGVRPALSRRLTVCDLWCRILNRLLLECPERDSGDDRDRKIWENAALRLFDNAFGKLIAG